MDTENTPINEVAPQEVETPSEQVVDTETSTDAPVVIETDTAKNNSDWETRYKELQSTFTKTSQRNAELEKLVNTPVVDDYQPTTEPGENPFDEATTTGVMSLAEKAAEVAWEKREAAKWVKQNADDLKDPIVDSRTRDLIRQGYDRDTALTQAKSELSERVSPIQKEALAQGVKEGQALAHEKEKMGAIGQPGSSDRLDPKVLGSKEFAIHQGLTYVD